MPPCTIHDLLAATTLAKERVYDLPDDRHAAFDRWAKEVDMFVTELDDLGLNGNDVVMSIIRSK